MANVHAHKVLNHLEVKPSTESELRTWIAQQFGDNVHFNTCKCENLNTDTLLSFLQQHDKVIVEDGKWHLNRAQICQHD